MESSEENIEIIENEKQISNDVDEILSVLEPRMEVIDGREMFTYDGEAVKKVLDKIKGKEKLKDEFDEVAIVENELLGVRIVLKSSVTSSKKLLELALGGVSNLIKKTPTRIPLGIM